MELGLEEETQHYPQQKCLCPPDTLELTSRSANAGQTSKLIIKPRREDDPSQLPQQGRPSQTDPYSPTAAPRRPAKVFKVNKFALRSP